MTARRHRPTGPSRTAGPRALAVAGAGLAALLLGPVTPAAAHGAPTAPLSRAAACGTEGGATARTAACRAARAANGDPTFADWDNLRVPGVDGRDREVIPDGKLCSGGLAAFRGLDLPRADWPTTTLTAGAPMAFTYRATIAHQGEFRFYVTKDGYDPTRPLRWADLETAPFLRVTDPPLVDGSYRIKGTLPAHRTGRQLIYTIWQNAGTDTYYSCSDVVVHAAGAAGSAAPVAGATATPRAAAAASPKAQAVPGAPVRRSPSSLTPPPGPTPPPAPAAAAIARTAAVVDDSARWTMPAAVGGVGLLAGALGLAAITAGRRLRRRGAGRG